MPQTMIYPRVAWERLASELLTAARDWRDEMSLEDRDALRDEVRLAALELVAAIMDTL